MTIALASATRARPPLRTVAECVRCNGEDDVAMRRLWSDPSVLAPLCRDCNDIVQGPDHMDIDTENLA